MTLAELLARAPLLADGAMGTMLVARGQAEHGGVEALNLIAPNEVRDVHAAYVAAGADLICTNTFAANRRRFEDLVDRDTVTRTNAAGVHLARAVAADAGRTVLVAGDVGPLGARLAPYGRTQPSEARAIFSEQIAALLAAGVDLLLFETFADIRELIEALGAARGLSDLPLVATMTFTRDDRTLLGEPAARVALALHDAGADIAGVNCAAGPAQALRLLHQMRGARPQLPLAVKPNAGWPEQTSSGRLAYPATPAYFADYVRPFADAGVVILGGCCGTTPEHIAAMRRALDEAGLRPGFRPGLSQRDALVPSAGERASVQMVMPASPLAQRLHARALVVTVEMSPPKGLNTQALLAGAHLLKEAGADAINVADSPRARMRMSPWALCHLIQTDVGLDTVLHFPLRGRNLLRVQGDLLAAHALGIRNLFAVMGDPTAIGDHPGAMDAYDVVPSGLIRLVKQGLNTGVDHAGTGIGEPTSFFVGCALNMGAADVDKEIRALRKKLDAGADFVLSQPVFDAAVARAFLARWQEQHGALAVPLVAGVLPLYGARHATFLHNEVPGIQIPAALRARSAAGGRDEGVRIALEIIAELRPLVGGIYLMPPFSKWDMAADVIEAIRA